MRPVNNQGGSVHRLYNPSANDHLLTVDENEKRELQEAGWEYEGVAFEAPRGGVIPIYRLYDPASGDHLFSANYEEAQTCWDAGWEYEGVPFFGSDDGVDVYRFYNAYSTITSSLRTRKRKTDSSKQAGLSRALRSRFHDERRATDIPGNRNRPRDARRWPVRRLADAQHVDIMNAEPVGAPTNCVRPGVHCSWASGCFFVWYNVHKSRERLGRHHLTWNRAISRR